MTLRAIELHQIRQLSIWQRIFIYVDVGYQSENLFSFLLSKKKNWWCVPKITKIPGNIASNVWNFCEIGKWKQAGAK